MRGIAGFSCPVCAAGRESGGAEPRQSEEPYGQGSAAAKPAARDTDKCEICGGFGGRHRPDDYPDDERERAG